MKEFSASTPGSLPADDGESESHSPARPTHSCRWGKGVTDSGVAPRALTHGRSGANILRRWNIYHGSREYAHELGDPLLGSVEATTKEEAEAKAHRFCNGGEAGYWAVPA